MTSLSKYYAAALCRTNCKQVFHPTRTCWLEVSHNLIKIFPICAKFYGPILCIQLLRQSNNLTKETLQEIIQTGFLLTFSTYLGSAFGQSLTCVFNCIFGKMYIPTFVFLPAFIGNMWGFMMPKKVNDHITNGLSVMIVEAHFLSDETFYWRLIKNSNAFRTVLFMVLSGIILKTRTKSSDEMFWFIQAQKNSTINKQPIPSPWFDSILPVENHICSHSDPCDLFALKGIKTSLTIGISIELANLLISNFSLLQKHPSQIFTVLSKVKLQVVVFLIGYTSIYRILMCTLNRYNKKNTEYSSALAGFVSGLTFCLYPNLTILAHASITAIKLMWLRLMQQHRSKGNENAVSCRLIRYLDSLPMAKFFYILNIGYVFHLRAFYPWMCPKLLLKAVQYTSGFNADAASERFNEYILGFK